MKTIFNIIFVVSIIAWIYFIFNGMILHTWVANAFTWISVILLRQENIINNGKA